MENFKSIETSYRGYRFRSRLEARWAVYFDAMGIRWEYEPEGFELNIDWYKNPPNGVTIEGLCRYLPDFWLPEVQQFAEVKPKWFSSDEIALASWLQFYHSSSKGVLLLDGIPDDRYYFAVKDLEFEHGCWNAYLFEYEIRLKEPCLLWHGDGHYITSWPEKPISRESTRMRPSQIAGGIAAARSARFEHGENPSSR